MAISIMFSHITFITGTVHSKAVLLERYLKGVAS